MPSTSTKPAWTMDRLAEEAGVNLRTIKRAVVNGEIPSFTIGRSRRIPGEAAEALLRGEIQLGGGAPKASLDDIDAYIRHLVDAAPRLSDRQIAKLSAIVKGAK